MDSPHNSRRETLLGPDTPPVIPSGSSETRLAAAAKAAWINHSGEENDAPGCLGPAIVTEADRGYPHFDDPPTRRGGSSRVLTKCRRSVSQSR